jgi:CubicO group peptidase (beta-lactamase class C family)
MIHHVWKTTRVAALAVVVALVAASLAPGAASASSHGSPNSGVGPPGSHQIPAGPGADPWDPVPRDQVAEVCGLDPDLLDEIDEQFANAFSIVRFGRLCWTGGGGAPADETYGVFSVTKSFGATLVGMVAARSSLSDTDLVSEWLTPAEMAANPLLGRTGTINPNATIAHMLATTSTKPNLGVDQKGTFVYDTLGTRELNRLILVINRVIEREPENFPGITTAYQFAQQELFDVIGMHDSRWAPGTGFGFGLESSVHDMARLGLLWLRKGNWDGAQLIDEAYMYRMLHPAFPDTNPGYGYATWLNTASPTSSVAPTVPVCAPYATWPEYPHEPFFEATHDYGGSPFDDQPFDIGLAYAAGAGGQWIIVHRGLDMVFTARSLTPNGPQILWDAVRPALVALDPVFQGDEAGFCEQYQASAYAPTLLSGWAPRNVNACLNGGWRYGPWRNQGQCVSHFSRSG